VVAMTGFRSVMTAVRLRLSGIPPKRATSGFLPVAAMAANRTNDTTFLGARYRRLARRIGKLKALVALPAGKATASKVQARNGSWSAITQNEPRGTPPSGPT